MTVLPQLERDLIAAASELYPPESERDLDRRLELTADDDGRDTEEES